jgi:hypothetical protein
VTLGDAYALLGLPPDAPAASLDAALGARVGDVRARLAEAPTASLRVMYEQRLASLAEAAQLLGGALPADAPEAPPVRTPPSPPIAVPGSAARGAPHRGRHAGGLVVAVLLGAAVVYAGWWLVRRPRVVSDVATGLEFVAPRGAALAIGRTEVTQAQFARFAVAARYRTDAERTGACLVYDGGPAKPAAVSWRDAPGSAPNAPVVCVSWNDAAAYTRWASQASGTRVRLPTAAEWSWAAGAGGRGAYSFGDDAAGIARHANTAGPESRLPWAARGAPDPYPRLAPVARFAANAFGVHDVHGNASEWIDEAYSPTQRTLRGGGWASHPANTVIGARNAMPPDEASVDVGFRVVRDLR